MITSHKDDKDIILTVDVRMTRGDNKHKSWVQYGKWNPRDETDRELMVMRSNAKNLKSKKLYTTSINTTIVELLGPHMTPNAHSYVTN